MNRRDLIKGIFATSVAVKLLNNTALAQNNEPNNNKKFAKLNPLKVGDKIAIVAPGTNVINPDDIEKAIEAVKWLGLEPVFGDTFNNKNGYKTKNAELRANDINNMFKNQEIKALFCIRGGYGSQQTLRYLDFDLIMSNPKIFLGYSDITAIHIALNKFAGFPTFHGPVMLSAFNNFTANNLKSIIFNENSYPLVLTNPDSLSGIRKTYPMRTINSGIAKGKLVGGNLSLISALMGTKYEIDVKNKILFIEDVGEAPFRIDRMLGQLSISGKLSKASGIVFGKCEECIGEESTWDASLGEVLDYYLKPLGIPVFYGLLFGHSSNQLTIPENVLAEIDADKQTLTLLESPFI